MKYIIKNCPALLKGAEKWARGFKDDEYLCNDRTKWCEDCSDCVIKQIVKLCNDELEQETDPLNSSGKSLAQKILNLLEMEEVDE